MGSPSFLSFRLPRPLQSAGVRWRSPPDPSPTLNGFFYRRGLSLHRGAPRVSTLKRNGGKSFVERERLHLPFALGNKSAPGPGRLALFPHLKLCLAKSETG